MTAAAGVLTGLAKLKRQDSSRSQHHRPVAAPPPGGLQGTQEGLPRKRKRRADVVVVRGTLRLYSASGFFLLLGLVILALGIGMATLGYWPHRGDRRHHHHRNDTVPFLVTRGGDMQMASRGGDARGVEMATGGGEEEAARMYNSSAGDVVTPGNSTAAAGATSRGLLGRFLEQHRHSERMKMLGPFTMGIGIFIFICANAILHENRDRETKVIHMRDMYSTVIDIHRLRQREYKHRPQPLRRGSFYAPSEPGERGGGGGGEEEEGLLQGEFQRGRWWGGGLVDSRPRRVDAERGRGACSIVTSSLSAFAVPVIKLNNCVIDEPEMEAIITEEEQRHRGAAAAEEKSWGPMRTREQQEERSGMLSLAEEKSWGPMRTREQQQERSGMLSLAVPVAAVAKASSKPPGLQRSLSATCSPRSSSSSSLSRAAPSSSASGCWLSPGRAATRSHQDLQQHQGNSSSSSFPSPSPSLMHCMLGGHSKSLDLERRVPSALSVLGGRGGGAEHHHHHQQQQQQRIERKHPSWPRLDRSSSSGGGGSRGGSKGYVLLEDREEGTTGDRSGAAAAAARRDYSKREKLHMISRSHNNLSFEHDEFDSGALKRGSSETRF